MRNELTRDVEARRSYRRKVRVSSAFSLVLHPDSRFIRLMRGIFWRLGYRLSPRSSKLPHDVGTLYPYVGPDGEFDYDRYRRIQEEGNRKKIDRVWVKRENIEYLSTYILERLAQPKFAICHGTRRGLEQKWFREFLACEVIGTEISEAGAQFPHTIIWDFHEIRPEWVDSADFIYSNSFDHSYDPEKCLNAWMECVRPGGICILEHWSKGATALDPFGADMVQMPYLITKWGKGRYGVRELLSAPVRDEASDLGFIVIQRFAK